MIPGQPDRLALPAPEGRRRGRLRLDNRVALRLFILAAALVIVGTLSVSLIRTARGWLVEQPTYLIPFSQITLDPPPPAWFPGGARQFLEDVRKRTNMPEAIPVLKLREDELRTVFRRSPLIEDVGRVLYPPLAVVVHIQYKQPVAVVCTSSQGEYLVDGLGIILAAGKSEHDLDPIGNELGLIRIKGIRLYAPRDPALGLPWQPAPGMVDVAAGNGRIRSAAKLAAFLLERMHSIDRKQERSLDMVLVNPMDRLNRGLFVQNADGAWILWGDAPGEEPTGTISSTQKWQILEVWSKSPLNQPIPETDYWYFDGTEIKRAHFDPPAGAPTDRLARPTRDRQAIPTNGPG